MNNQKPLYSCRAGGKISASIWSNTATVNGKQVGILKVTVQNRYKDKASGEWKTTSSFSKSELPQLIWALQKCYDKLMCEESTEPDAGMIDEEIVI
jgi:hypothetical protein